jgi:hypothetical protein
MFMPLDQLISDHVADSYQSQLIQELLHSTDYLSWLVNMDGDSDQMMRSNTNLRIRWKLQDRVTVHIVNDTVCDQDDQYHTGLTTINRLTQLAYGLLQTAVDWLSLSASIETMGNTSPPCPHHRQLF